MLLRSVDALYAGVVISPEAWDDSALAEWLSGLGDGSGGYSKTIARELRRSLRNARRMRDFWLIDDSSRPDDAGDWRTRVDLAMGVRAWRPPLAIAQEGLLAAPTPELFDEVQERFRVVSSERWMEGVGYEEWLAEQSSPGL